MSERFFCEGVVSKDMINRTNVRGQSVGGQVVYQD